MDLLKLYPNPTTPRTANRITKMKYEIKNRWSDAVQFVAEIDCDESEMRSMKIGLAVKWGISNNANFRDADLRDANLRDADLRDANLRDADLRYADLRYADLGGADLGGANLRGADLWGANLGGANLWGVYGINNYVKCLQVNTYPITYTSDRLQIGCENHGIDKWREFDNQRILEMDGKKALKWWRRNKKWLFKTIEKFPAEPTNQEESK